MFQWEFLPIPVQLIDTLSIYPRPSANVPNKPHLPTQLNGIPANLPIPHKLAKTPPQSVPPLIDTYL